MCEGPIMKNPELSSIKRNPKVRFIKADMLKKHEKIRDQEFDQKISDLICPNPENDCHVSDSPKCSNGSKKENRNSNFQRFSLDEAMESLNDKTDSEELGQPNDEFIIAQNYGSYDDEEKSIYSSMKGESISGDFNLEIVGSKIEAPKPFDPHNLEEDTNKQNNVSHLGFKRTFGEPSGDVFGLTFDPECTGIFRDCEDYEFQPVNTIEDNN